MTDITSKYAPEIRFSGTKCKVIAIKIAMPIFVKTPAEATNSSAKRPLNIKGLYGTGFAHPAIPPETNRKIDGTTIEPTKSRCFRGFGVSLPAIFAVGSPKKSAA